MDEELGIPLEETAQESLEPAVWCGRAITIVIRWALHVISTLDSHVAVGYAVGVRNATNGAPHWRTAGNERYSIATL